GPGLDFARAINPDAVAVKQEPQHHLWSIGRSAAAIFRLIRGIDRTQLQRLHHIHQKTRQMLFWKPIVQRRRQKQSLIQIVGAETLSHVSHYKLVMTYITPYFCCSMRSISDTHLATGNCESKSQVVFVLNLVSCVNLLVFITTSKFPSNLKYLL